MSQKEVNLQSLSLIASFLFAYIGLVHEVVGPTLFPLAPAWLGAFLWHGIGVFAMSSGILCIMAVLGVIKFPVVHCGILMGIVGVIATLLAAYRFREFHFFGVSAAIAGFVLAISHSKAIALKSANTS